MVFPKFHFLEKLVDAYYIRQINAFTEWLARHSLERETVFIDVPRQERVLGKGSPLFIFCAPSGFPAALKKIGRHDINAWHTIFNSPAYEIWEQKGTYEKGALPLRFGLSDEEKNFALAHARRTLDEYLKTGKRDTTPPENVPDKFLEKTSVDVALWVRGALRGSYIVENLPLIDAIRKAAIHSCRDERFKPLVAEELDIARIEIAVLSDLRMPLLGKEIRANTIATEKGYVISAQGKRGWFLPAVLNVITFKGLDDFLTYLIEKKVGVPKAFLRTADISIFEVDNFIESSRSSRIALSLHGPVVKHEISLDNALSILDKIAIRGADFLYRIQEADGNIPPIINPLTGKRTQIDWIRLALTAWSLALMGSVNHTPRYVNAAHKAFTYIVNNLYTHPYLSDETRCASFVYAYKLANVLGETTEAARMHAAILNLLPKLSYGSIRSSQIALHLLECGRDDATLLRKAEELSNAVLQDYEQRVQSGEYLEPARFAELIPILRTIGELRDNPEMIQKSEAISKWYVSLQLPDGSFPGAVGSSFAPYTRGTGKVFEVLCLEPEKNRVCIERTIAWLSEMQYDEDNTYFVEESIQKEISGGFRHDYVNQAVWIDAVGHILLGAARLLDKTGDK